MFREILNRALAVAGNQENLASKMDVSPSALSKKLKGEAGWSENDLDVIFRVSEFCAECQNRHSQEVAALSETIHIILKNKQSEQKPLFKKEKDNDAG
jgi:DNA-binding transcriptional regulator YdaS (Cro superfamily)